MRFSQCSIVSNKKNRVIFFISIIFRVYSFGNFFWPSQFYCAKQIVLKNVLQVFKVERQAKFNVHNMKLVNEVTQILNINKCWGGIFKNLRNDETEV